MEKAARVSHFHDVYFNEAHVSFQTHAHLFMGLHDTFLIIIYWILVNESAVLIKVYCERALLFSLLIIYWDEFY